MAAVPSSVVTGIECLVALLQKCRHQKNVVHARELHAYMCEHSLESHRILGNYLVPSLVECDCLPDAQHAFDRLPLRTEQSWCSLFLGYTNCGNPRHALLLYEKMQHDQVKPNSHTFVTLLKTCSILHDAFVGSRLHTDIIKHGLDGNTFVGNTLIDMYGKSGSLLEARGALDMLCARDVISWTSLISEYVEHDLCDEAFKCFETMQLDGVSPNANTYPCCLKACSLMCDGETGQLLYTEIVNRGFEGDLFIGSAVVDMYGKCGLLADAQLVFDKLPLRDVASWNALIDSYAEYGLVRDAQKCFEQMQVQGVSPVSVTYVCYLKACSMSGASEAGMQMHCEIIKRGSEGELYVGNALVDMYIKCGFPAEAQRVFEKLQDQSAVAWNALITGYAEHGFGEEALVCFKRMQQAGFSPIPVSFVCSLKACGITSNAETGKHIHTAIVKIGVENEPFVGTTLIDMYVKCGLLSEGQEVFLKLPGKVMVSWNALIGGYVENGFAEEALNCFQQMQIENISADVVTLVCTSKACGMAQALDIGQAVHNEILEKGFEREEVGNILVDMYAKCSFLKEAHHLFDKLTIRTVVPWTAIIAGYTKSGLVDDALDLYGQMLQEGISPDANMFLSVLKACGLIGALKVVQKLHMELTKQGLEKGPHVGHALVDIYGRWGSFVESQKAFDVLPMRYTISWYSILAGFAEGDISFEYEAMGHLKLMLLDGMSSIIMLFAARLKACGSIGALHTGRVLHMEAILKGFDMELFIGNTLIDMYGKCGLLDEAHNVFNNLPLQDTVSWNAILMSYGENGQANLAIEYFEHMRRWKVKPDAVTFTCILSACSQGRMVSRGEEYFKMMMEEYGIEPAWDHYTCVVDLLARAGYFLEVEKFCEAMECCPSKEILRALLTACKMYGLLELALRYFEALIQLGAADGAAYSLMVDIFTSAGMFIDAKKLEEMRKGFDAKKKPASAVIELNGKVYEFAVGDHCRKNLARTIGTLNTSMRHEGYVPNMTLIMDSYD